MIKQYGLAPNKTHVDQYTLLDSNNVVPTWESGSGEAIEVSNALLKLREEYDEIRKKALKKDAELVLNKAEILKAKEEQKRVSKDFGGISNDIEQSVAELHHLKTTHEFQKLENMGFNYMLDRMKRDLISLNLTINDLTESLRSKKGFSEEECSNLMKAREQKLQSILRLKNLTMQLKRDQVHRSDRIVSLNQSIKNKEDAIQKRQNRQLNQSKIREEAQNESKDQNEAKLRAAFLVQKVWSKLYKKQMEHLMTKYEQTEKAFVMMRACAGNANVQQMVDKFMTREQTYTSLLQNISKLEDKFITLKKNNEVSTVTLSQLKIEHDHKKKLGYVHPNQDDRDFEYQLKQQQVDNKTEVEYHRLTAELDQLKTHLSQLKKRKTKIELTIDQVGGWSSRVMNKLAQEFDDHTFIGKQTSMLQTFKNLSTIVHQQLNQIIDTAQEDQVNDVGYDIDFCTSEFVEKNVRVRPSSTKFEDDPLTRNSQGEEEESKTYNVMQQQEINTARNELKERKRKEQEERQLLAEKQAKKKLKKQ